MQGRRGHEGTIVKGLKEDRKVKGVIDEHLEKGLMK